VLLAAALLQDAALESSTDISEALEGADLVLVLVSAQQHHTACAQNHVNA
jgi:hypothetical protein